MMPTSDLARELAQAHPEIPVPLDPPDDDPVPAIAPSLPDDPPPDLPAQPGPVTDRTMLLAPPAADPGAQLAPIDMMAVPARDAAIDEAHQLAQRAMTVLVIDQATCRKADELTEILRTFDTAVHAKIDPTIEFYHTRHKVLTTLRAEWLDPVTRAINTLKTRAGDWLLAERRKQEELRRKLEEEARQREQARLLAEAASAEQAGDQAAADAILHEAQTAPAPVVYVPTTTPKLEHSALRTSWKARVTSLKALARAVADGAVSEEALIGLERKSLPGRGEVIRSSYLDKMASANKDTLAIPGVQSYEDAKLAGKA
jgi:hypothetical protein